MAVYNWVRYWYPRGTTVDIEGGGYLYRLHDEWARIYQPNVNLLETLCHIPCLILLGEPGIGKSNELKKQEVFTRQALSINTLWFDLGGYQTETMLSDDLFNAPEFQFWVNGTHPLHLFLDSLDEGLLTISTLVRLLSRRLRQFPVSRLYLRITCRAADWPNSFEEELRNLWGDKNTGVYLLAPLQRTDVFKAAVAEDINAQQFLDEISHREVVSLANKPFTLRFLLNTYKENRTFPSTRLELFNKGCRLLCEETNDNRRDAGLTGSLDSEERLIIASRIAALMVFANRAAAWSGVSMGDVPQGDITLQELQGGRECAGGYEISITEPALKESLATGLFTPRGPKRMGWAHRTYAEFLAARYLVQHEVPLAQIMSLLVHPDDTEARLVPQLHETAAWLATMRPDVFRQIMKLDPEVLLRSDVTTAEEKDRADLVDTLLNLQDDARLIYLHSNFSSFYSKLEHSGLSAQLVPFISDSTFSEATRLTAIDIAEACVHQDLQKDLTSLVFDLSQSRLIREEAAQAITHIGDEETKVKLKVFAVAKGENDPNDQLKGYALRALWPAFLTPEELFTALTPPKMENFIGSYHIFLTSEFLEYIQPTDLPIALHWVENLPSRSEMLYRSGAIFKIANQIMSKAWQHLDTPTVLEAFARAIVSRLERFDNIIEEPENQELSWQEGHDEIRHQLLEAIFLLLSERHGDPIALLYCKPRLILRQDVPWLINYLLKAEADELQRIVARLINRVFQEDDVDLVSMVFDACEHNVILSDEFAWLLNPVELGSPAAQRMKEDYLREQDWLQEKSHQTDAPSSMEHLATLLDECEEGDISAWNNLYWKMTSHPDGSLYKTELRQTAFPGWDIADEPIRARMLETAKKYIEEQKLESHKWLGTDNIPYESLVMYKTMQLLMQEAPEFFSNLPIGIWKELVPILLTWSDPTTVVLDHELIRMAYQFASDEVIQTTLLLIDSEDKKFEDLPVIQKVGMCWDERLAQALLGKIQDDTLKPGSIERLLRELLEHDNEVAKTFALSLISAPQMAENAQAKAIVAAKALFMYADDAGWSTLWPLMLQDDDFGMKLVAKVAYSSPGRISEQLTEDQIADLYIWLARHYPPSQYPVLVESSVVAAADSIAQWRDTVLDILKVRGTFRACGAIQRIAREIPDLVDQLSLNWILLEAQNLARRRTWIPFSPEAILRVVNDNRLRLVQSEAQLLEVVIESLQRLEAKFRDEAPAWRDVWDRIPVAESARNGRGRKKKQREHEYRPIDENDFSNYVKRHLDNDLLQRGVIANREVVIRKDERTDIHVDTVIRTVQREIYDKVSVIIEVKGCWNRELYTAMKEQLVDRYLRDNRCQHGIYLIGWFNCAEWGTGDYRKDDAPKISIDEARRQFDDQATELSRQGIEVSAMVLNAAIR